VCFPIKQIKKLPFCQAENKEIKFPQSNLTYYTYAICSFNQTMAKIYETINLLQQQVNHPYYHILQLLDLFVCSQNVHILSGKVCSA
jgi:hypothetical protein